MTAIPEGLTLIRYLLTGILDADIKSEFGGGISISCDPAGDVELVIEHRYGDTLDLYVKFDQLAAAVDWIREQRSKI